MTTEQLLLQHWHSLPEEKQKEVLDFAEFLRSKQTTVPDGQKKVKRRFPPASIAGKGKTLGDIVSPVVDEQDWECLK